MKKMFEVTVDSIVEYEDYTLMKIENKELSFNGSIITCKDYTNMENGNIEYYSIYIPLVDENIILLPEDIVYYFNLYDYCDDHVPEIEYESLDYSNIDASILSIFEE